MRRIQRGKCRLRVVQSQEIAVCLRRQLGGRLGPSAARAQHATLGRAERDRSGDGVAVPHTRDELGRKAKHPNEQPEPADRDGIGLRRSSGHESVETPRESIVGRGQRRWRCHLERSEEHTSELQSRLHLVCRLLLEKKKKKYGTHKTCDKQY